MPPLIFTPEAQADIHRTWRFLAGKDMKAATEAVKAIRASVRLLSQHPEAGRPTEECGLEFREWLIDFGNSGYVALYRYDAEAVVVLAVRHQKEFGYTAHNLL